MSSNLRHIGKYRIPFHFSDKEIAIRVTKYTTCDDVIEMVLQKEGVSVAYASSYVLHEKTSRIHRVIAGRSLVVKLWRSWGCESNNFKFTISRKQEDTAAAKTGLRLKNLTTEGNIDALFVNHYKNQDLAIKDEGKRRRKVKTANANRRRSIATSNLDALRENETESEKSNMVETTDLKSTKKKDKSFVLTRFFNDLKKTNQRVRKRLSLSTRKSGDGAEETYVRHSDVSATYESNLSLSSTLHERCQYAWDKYSFSDTDSDSSGEFSLEDDPVTWFDQDGNDVDGKLDTAFVKSRYDSDSDEGIDVTSVTSIDLNAAFVSEAEITGFSRQSSTVSLQETTNVCELERNISNDEFIKKLFGNRDNVREDDEMDSFMCSGLDAI